MIRWFKEASRRYGERAAQQAALSEGWLARDCGMRLATRTHTTDATHVLMLRVYVLWAIRVCRSSFTWNLLYCDKAASRCMCTIAHSILCVTVRVCAARAASYTPNAIQRPCVEAYTMSWEKRKQWNLSHFWAAMLVEYRGERIPKFHLKNLGNLENFLE